MTRKYTWQELRQHNKEENAHVAYRGKVYDIHEFISKHPGGKEAISLGIGNDITHLFESYHSMDITRVLDKYCVGDLEKSEFPTFPEMSLFYKTLRTRVKAYFESANIDPKWDKSLFACYALAMMGVFIFHFLMVYFWANLPLASILAVATGFCTLFGMWVGHDGGHFSLTHKPVVWKLMEVMYDVTLGASSLLWRYRHTLAHHTYTNVENADPDIHTSYLYNDSLEDCSWVRLHEAKKWYIHHTIQHMILPLLYLLDIAGVRIDDIICLLTSKYAGTISINPFTREQWIIFWFGKVVWITMRIIIPLCFIPWYTMLYLSLLAEFVTSYLFILTIAGSHLNRNTAYPPEADADNKIHRDWAELQIQCSFDYCPESTFWTIVSGGTNNQITHHLFPGVCIIHLPKIVPILRETCKEFGIEYHCLESPLASLFGHFSQLKYLGCSPEKTKLF